MEKKGFIVLTRENFVLKLGEKHVITIEDGKHEIDCYDKKSKFGTGHQTVYSCKIDGTDYKDKPIGFYKGLFNAVVNHRDGFTKSVKVLTEDEIAKAVTNFESKVNGLLNSLNTLIEKVSENAEKVSYNVPNLCSLFRDNLNERNEKAKVEKANAEKANAEKAEKAERKELAKAVTTFDDMQKALLKAIAEKDFTKVAELTAKMQSA